MAALVGVTITWPTLLIEAVGTGRVRVQAATLRGALDAAFDRIPNLKRHLCEDSGRFRAHVLCFHNDTDTRDLPSLDVGLREGDTITFIQAVSGG